MCEKAQTVHAADPCERRYLQLRVPQHRGLFATGTPKSARDPGGIRAIRANCHLNVTPEK